MSRIGKKPIPVPADVNVKVQDRVISIDKGPSKLALTHRPEVLVAFDSGTREITCSIPESSADDRLSRALWGTTRALIASMIKGVVEGYEKKLEVVGVGWTAQLAGKTLKLNVGYCNTVELPVPQGLTVAVEKQMISIKGADKQQVGEFAAKIRSKRKPEPYNGKGIKYFDEVIIRKQGKAVVGR